MNSASRPNACPFVAFDDDRDRRAESPDPRHRCFAVPNPEPRAIAHQAAYCLTPNFPSCAFFMDWAARAAAAPLQGSGSGFGPAQQGGYAGYGSGMAGHESPGSIDPGGRPWAAPPPWVADPDLRGTTPDGPQPLYGQPSAGQGYAPYGQPGVQPYVPLPQAPPPDVQPPYPQQPALPTYQPSADTREPEQLTALPEEEEPEHDRDYDLSGDVPAASVEPPAAPRAASVDAGFNPDPGILPVPSEVFPADEAFPDSGSLAPLPPTTPREVQFEPYVAPTDDDMPAFVLPPTASPPARAPAPPSPPMISSPPLPQSRLPYTAVPLSAVPPTAYAPAGPESWSNPGSPYGSMPDDMDPTPPAPEQRSRLTGRPIGAAAAPRLDPQARKPVKKRSDAEWSKPRRFEAYPTLGGRMRMGGLSPVLVGAFVVAIVALLLFLLPGFLSGQGNAPVASRTPSVTATVEPTSTPEPTPQSYTVKGGDVLSAIAKNLGLTVAQITCFNNLKNPNSLSIGQVLLIPPADYICPPKPSPTRR